MDFFTAQDSARKRSHWMVALFAIAVVCIAVAIYFVVVYAQYALLNYTDDQNHALKLWQPTLLFWSFLGVSAIVSGSSLYKIAQLRAGGGYVARSVGGKPVNSDTNDPDERKLLNIVEEMSIASGVSMPEVYIMEEASINGFAAGFQTADAAIAVTRGCIETLSRDELQGVIAHEFSHILNGDMRLNIRLTGALFGLLVIAVIGQTVLRGTAEASFYAGASRRRSSRENNGGGLMVAILAISLAIMIIGYIGVFFGRLIQSAISRQREFLADAAAVQFTRNPESIGGALKKIGGSQILGKIQNPHAQELAHCFFASAFTSGLQAPFATHPPLEKRIQAIEPNWDGNFVTPKFKTQETPPPIPAHKRPERQDDFIQSIGQIGAAAVIHAQTLRQEIGPQVDTVNQSRDQAGSALLALQIAASPANEDTAQLLIVRNATLPEVQTSVQNWLPQIRGLSLNQRFALLEIALPKAASQDSETLQVLEHCLTELAHQDGEINLEEMAILRIVQNFIEARQKPSRHFKPLPPQELQEPVETLLSALVHSSKLTDEAAQAAFTAGARKCTRYLLRQPQLLPVDAIDFPQLETALDKLAHLPTQQKKAVFEGAIATVLADEEVEDTELSLIRIIAASLDLPMPPL